jgi:hypothetical protein
MISQRPASESALSARAGREAGRRPEPPEARPDAALVERCAAGIACCGGLLQGGCASTLANSTGLESRDSSRHNVLGFGFVRCQSRRSQSCASAPQQVRCRLHCLRAHSRSQPNRSHSAPRLRSSRRRYGSSSHSSRVNRPGKPRLVPRLVFIFESRLLRFTSCSRHPECCQQSSEPRRTMARSAQSASLS